MKSPTAKRFAAGPALLWLVAAGTFAAGVAHFYKTGITLVQAGYCAISAAGAWVLLLLLEYTLHHARIVFVLVLAMLAVFAIQSPAFRVGLGMALATILVMETRR